MWDEVERNKNRLKLKHIRTEILGMSQSALAKAIGIRRQTITEWETGKTLNPTLTFKQSAELDRLLEQKGYRLSDLYKPEDP